MSTITITPNSCSCCVCNGAIPTTHAQAFYHMGTFVRVCQNCATTSVVECSHCGSEFLSDDGEEVDGGTWCPDCAGDKVVCECCGNFTTSGEVRDVYEDGSDSSSEEWCEDCVDANATFCERCEYAYASLTTYEMWDGREVELCDDCAGRFEECSVCGRLVSGDDVVCDDYSDTPYCPNCWEEAGDLWPIEEYGSTDADAFVTEDGDEYETPDPGELYLAVELEVSDLDSSSAAACELYSSYESELAFKKDCSLGDPRRSVEIVSRKPAHPAWLTTDDMWSDVSAVCRSYNGTSYDNGRCGLHIHISRTFFEGLDPEDYEYRMDRLFHRFRNELIDFSRRTEFGYCRLNDDGLDELEVKDRKEEWKKKRNDWSRYQAVNCTNSATVEIRLWRGTLNMETFNASIEMTAGLAYVARYASDEITETLNWDKLKLLVRYALEENGISHKDLDAYLERRGL